ncbi:MAG: hypothetical protein LCH91_26440 [Bacteroidetes bacterium]|nr:hypothetical protein [Bacteroidota bacterium]
MEKLKIKYKFNNEYNPKYINGAIGGVNPSGEIVINFYLERRPIPNSTVIEVKDGLPTNNIIGIEPEDFGTSMIRFMENGVIMNYQTAKEVHRWLGEQLKQIENL